MSNKPRYKQVALSSLAPGDIFWKMPNRKRCPDPEIRLDPNAPPSKGYLVEHVINQRGQFSVIKVRVKRLNRIVTSTVWAGIRVWVEADNG